MGVRSIFIIRVQGLGFIMGCLNIPTPIMENQMCNDMETGVIWALELTILLLLLYLGFIIPMVPSKL